MTTWKNHAKEKLSVKQNEHRCVYIEEKKLNYNYNLLLTTWS